MSKRSYYWFLVVPFIATLVPPFYARRGPTLFGFPFFYWYQILWIVLAALVVWWVYLATRKASHE
ncbi:MAG TPA: DUF3311 domain-containing protein [Candidatus Baltobacteraceae bacterium]|nr:DUF3311 domain-containing protein [Candidatus Baltobacteraceae bacterium]